jgi:uncharacterized membrane protein YedE/YeeE
MRQLFLLSTGILFGIVLTKAEIVSWYRIQEMFRFQSFHMYGVIGLALVVSMPIIRILKNGVIKDLDGQKIIIEKKPPLFKSAILGGSIFGMGWAFTGACPGPIYILIGNGYLIYLIVLLSAVIGAFLYGMISNRLPH